MGPLHFIIYIADMITLGLLGRMILYADDTALHYAFDTPEELEDAMPKDALLPDFNIKMNDVVVSR